MAATEIIFCILIPSVKTPYHGLISSHDIDKHAHLAHYYWFITNETKLVFIALELPQTSHAMAIAYNSGCIGVQLQMMSWHPVCLKENCLTITESVESFLVNREFILWHGDDLYQLFYVPSRGPYQQSWGVCKQKGG